ncbi:MAG: GAF domain-containing protein [Bacteroidetes bacterium]|nr:GAF domain-containing protein [Fibrella sp.]
MEKALDIPPLTDPLLRFSLSFKPLLAYLETQTQSSPSAEMSDYYDYLINQFTVAGCGNGSVLDCINSARLSVLFQLAAVVVLPLVHIDDDIPYAFGLPVPLRWFHQSASFRKLLDQFPDLMVPPPEKTHEEDRQRLAYRMILAKYYGIPLNQGKAPFFYFQKVINGLTKHYRIDMNVTFMEPELTDKLPAFEPVWIDFAKGLRQLPDPVNPLPIGAFTFTGFCFFQVKDVTDTETIQTLQDVFAHLQTDTEPMIYCQFENALRSLCGQPDLQVSIVPMPQVNGQFVQLPEMKDRSVFLRNVGTVLQQEDNRVTQEKIRKRAENPAPHLFYDLLSMPEPEQQALHEKGILSFMSYPIINNDEVLGVLEMGSPQPNAFDEGILTKIKQINPLIQEFLRYQLHQFNTNLERLIKDKFTSLQPAVEWKFNEAVWHYLQNPAGTATDRPDGGESTWRVAFEQVYPIYGAIDVRNSSQERANALMHDLRQQLQIAGELFNGLVSVPPQAVADWNHHRALLVEESVGPEAELSVTTYIQQELNPFLRNLATGNGPVPPLLPPYLDRLDVNTGQFNEARDAFESSLQQINTTLGLFLEREEQHVQTIYPHYFEKYRTDGLEYSLYVGQSLAPTIPFRAEHLKQIRFWQLNAMISMATLTHRLRPTLPVPLATTQLILTHGKLVDISFRRDERRFDVEGAYSIRYEVIKKRLDKAYIKGTDSRLTQPDTIAIVYANNEQVDEYTAFIRVLQQQGRLEPNAEFLDLDELQGVSGLRALRVRVKYD